MCKLKTRARAITMPKCEQAIVEFRDTRQPQHQIFSYTDANNMNKKWNQTFSKIITSLSFSFEWLQKKRLPVVLLDHLLGVWLLCSALKWFEYFSLTCTL